MPDSSSVLQLAHSYGLLGIGALLALVAVVVFVIWRVAHRVAQPGAEVKLLYGLATYTKKYALTAPQRAKPIEVIDSAFELMWRIQTPIAEWIDDDLSKLGDAAVGWILTGPYHATCKRDLSYHDRDSDEWLIERKCSGCGAQILRKQMPNQRPTFKRGTLSLLQEAHLRGEKIADGFVLTGRGDTG